MDNITLLRDGAPTRDSVQQALSELDSRVQPGDRVFIYLSGYGSRQFDAAEGGCVGTASATRHARRRQPPVPRSGSCPWQPRPTRRWCSTTRTMPAASIVRMPSAPPAQARARRGFGAQVRPVVMPAGNKTLRNRGLDSATPRARPEWAGPCPSVAARRGHRPPAPARADWLPRRCASACRGSVRDLDGGGDRVGVFAQAKIDVQLRRRRAIRHAALGHHRQSWFRAGRFTGNPAPHVTAPAITAPSPPCRSQFLPHRQLS